MTPAPIEAVVTKSWAYEDMLTIKVWDDRLGRLSSPRRRLKEAGFKDGDKVLIMINPMAD